MTWDEIEEQIREGIKSQPRGFQRGLAGKLRISRAAIGQWVRGGPIPRDRADAVLESLNLELTLQPRK